MRRLMLLALACLGCASPRAAPPAEPEPKPAMVAAAASRANAPRLRQRSEKAATQGSPQCQSGSLRLSERACSVRGNAGSFARTCVEGRWAETEQCRCTGVVKIPDPKLRAAIAKQLKLEGPLEAARVATLNSVDLKQTPVLSLEGLECFHGLEKLVLWQHQVEDLSPLAELSLLSDLTVANGRVRDLSPLANLSKLEKLSLSSNRILDLAPLRSLTSLASLSVGSNCITDLSPVQGMPKLAHLTASFNYIKDLTPLQTMPQIEVLVLSGNYFDDLTPLSKLYELHVLFVDSNGLRDVSALTGLRRFRDINIQRNQIDCQAQAKNIRKLEEHAKWHGGEVFHDCHPKALRARRMGRRDPLSQPVVRNKARDPRCAMHKGSKQ